MTWWPQYLEDYRQTKRNTSDNVTYVIHYVGRYQSTFRPPHFRSSSFIKLIVPCFAGLGTPCRSEIENVHEKLHLTHIVPHCWTFFQTFWHLRIDYVLYLRHPTWNMIRLGTIACPPTFPRQSWFVHVNFRCSSHDTLQREDDNNQVIFNLNLLALEKEYSGSELHSDPGRLSSSRNSSSSFLMFQNPYAAVSRLTSL